MTGHIVTGKLGAGKGKFGVSRMRTCLAQGRRVATNFNLHLEHLMPKDSRASVIRLPDRPTAADLLAIGHGNPDSYDEDRNGELHLDECASWLNARQFADKGRADLIDWFVHARKYGWSPFFYVQNLGMLDKQLREAIAHYHVKCINLHKIKLPIVGTLLGNKGRLPRFHVAQFILIDVPGVVMEKDYYRGNDLHDAYDTRQVFREWHRDPASPGFATEREVGPYSVLSAWHLAGRHAAPKGRVVALKPKLPAVELMARLSNDEAWALARRYARCAP